MQLYTADTAHNLQFRNYSDVRSIDVQKFFSRIERREVGLSGNFKDSAGFHAFMYKTEITSQDGLPCRASAE